MIKLLSKWFTKLCNLFDPGHYHDEHEEIADDTNLHYGDRRKDKRETNTTGEWNE